MRMMRGFLVCLPVLSILAMLAQGADTGVPPRGASTDYPVHERAEAATIAAAVIPEDQVKKMFSPEIGKRYIVVEVAIYPENDVPFDVKSSDFALRVGQRIGRADLPADVAPWPEAREAGPHPPFDVTTETGAIYQRSNDPAYGRQQGVGTYSGVGVTEPGQNIPPPPPDPRRDPRVVYDKVQRSSLADGKTKAVIAGYLYFPQYAKRKKSDEIELKYARHDINVNLPLGKP
jgi:hypothetical protein